MATGDSNPGRLEDSTGSRMRSGDGQPASSSLLVVDDDPDILRVVRFYLNKLQYRVVTATGGQEALKILRSDPTIELVLSDVMMPEMSGLELLKTIKANEEWAEIPVILISAESEISKKVAGLNLGADDFLNKPFNFDELTARVSNQLRMRRLQRELVYANDLLRQQNERFQEDLEAARTVQMALLPSSLPEGHGVKLGSRYLPMERVGGDFFDAVLLDQGHKLGVLVADVCGHGIAAALITAMTKITFRNACFSTADPAAVLELMNRTLMPNIKNGYVTAFYAVYDSDSHRVAYASGGHPPLLLHRRATDEIVQLQPQATFLGFFDKVRFQSEDVEVQAGDRVFFYTDGLYESRSPDEGSYGLERLSALIRKHGRAEIQAVVDEVIEDVLGFLGSRPRGDDITLVGMDIL